MRFARAVLWLSVITLAANGLTRNGRQLAILYKNREALAQIRKLPSGTFEREVADHSLTNGTIGLSARNFGDQSIRTATVTSPLRSQDESHGTAILPPVNHPSSAADPAIVEEIVELRKRIGRTSVADILAVVELPGGPEVVSGEQKNAGGPEPEELFRAALRQIPAGGLPARSAAESPGSHANMETAAASVAEFPISAGSQLSAIRFLPDWVWGERQSTRRSGKSR